MFNLCLKLLLQWQILGALFEIKKLNYCLCSGHSTLKVKYDMQVFLHSRDRQTDRRGL